MLAFQFCFYLVGADATSGDEFSLDRAVVADASNFDFGFEHRRGFKSLAQFLILSGMAKEEVKNSLQGLANPKQITLLEYMTGYVVPGVVVSALAGQSMEIVTGAYSVMNVMSFMPPVTSNVLSNFWGMGPHNIVSQGNVAGQAAGYRLRVQGFDDQEAVIERIKSQLQEGKPVMILIYDNVVAYCNVISCQNDNFICLKEHGERVNWDKNELLRAMDSSNSYTKRCIKYSLQAFCSHMGQFTIIEQNSEKVTTPTNEKLKQE